MSDERGSLLQRHLLLVQALCDPRTSKGDCQVLAVIGTHVGKDGEGYPGVNRIANKAGIHRTTVLASVDRLERWGYVEIERERGKANLYRIASTGSVHATSTSSAYTTSHPAAPVAPTHTTSSAHATTPVVPALPDQSRPRYPNSAFDLSSSNSEGTQLEPLASPEDQKQRRERLAMAKREENRAAYLQAKVDDPRLAKLLEQSYPYLLEDKAA